ncbi:hypothetical protein CapIbe_014307 [Capra ibex]
MFPLSRNATDGGGSQQTHKVAREESPQLIAQDTAGCENGLYKRKKKSVIFKKPSRDECLGNTLPLDRGKRGHGHDWRT